MGVEKTLGRNSRGGALARGTERGSGGGALGTRGRKSFDGS